jgi:signal transduction histidine kinase
VVANIELAFQNDLKEKRAAELVIATEELKVQNKEKEKQAAELVVANIELAFQNDLKEKRAAELVIATEELKVQNKEKEKRAAELVIANIELAFQNDQKEKRAAELVIANKELLSQNEEKEKRAAELVVANKELAFQNEEKEKRAEELIIANKELAFQNEEKEKRAEELIIANKELLFQNEEKEKRAAELVVANKELAFQNEEKEKRAEELIIANKDLLFQNEEKEKRAAELVVANKELAFQNEEKEKRAEELIKAKDQAEESDRLKLAFLANMSHEIRTPMNGILGFTELLKEPKLADKEQQEYIKIIEKSGKRMLHIINDIVNISKVESGQIDVIKSDTDVNDVLQYLHQFFTNETMPKGIQLSLTKKLNLDEQLILTDREKLYAATTNLLKNAIKFTPNLGTISFGCERKGEFLEFFVKDSGIGISKSQQEIIFDRFRQVDGSSRLRHEGSGLGLAISKAYIEILGDKIGIKSKVGSGSTFYFTLPYDPVIESSKKQHHPKKPVTTTGKNKKIKELKILIAEDDKISKLLISIMIKPYCRELIMVNNGSEAIEAFRNNPDIDLILTDINMPEMGGLEATKIIREFNKDIIIIAQTAYEMQSDRDDAIAAGCTDYISKPINNIELLALINKYF